MWNRYGVCSNQASLGEPPLLHMTTLTTARPAGRVGSGREGAEEVRRSGGVAAGGRSVYVL